VGSSLLLADAKGCLAGTLINSEASGDEFVYENESPEFSSRR
jgi:hypothetical protein